MGILERVLAGASFTRRTLTIPTFYAGIVSGAMAPRPGGAFILLNAESNKTTRIRLYSDSASVNIDASRGPTDFNLNDSVALISDISLIQGTGLSLDLNPPIIGNTFSNGDVWYHISSSFGPTAVNLTVYDFGVVGDSTTDRTSLIISRSSIPTTGYGVSGSITTKKSFIILSGSATTGSRLRLYSTRIEDVPSSEQTRSFDTASAAASQLIADVIFDTGSFAYKFVPVLEAYTWEAGNLSTGTGTLGYQLENRTGATQNITASLYILSTEE